MSMLSSAQSEEIRSHILSPDFQHFLFQSGVDDSAILDLRQIPYQNNLETWIANGFHGDMKWIERTLDLRVDPANAFPEQKTALVIAVSYHSNSAQSASQMNHISEYSQGRDYHKVLRSILKSIFFKLKSQYPELEGRWHVDSGPISEKYLASFTPLGWIGKSCNFVSHKLGSKCFLGTLVLNIEVNDYQEPKSRCGNCTACINACPTGAILPNHMLDARACISYQTIELKSQPPTHKSHWLYGCDTCLNACPFNKEIPETRIKDFLPRKSYTRDILASITDEATFLKLFEGSPIRRIGFQKFLENRSHKDTKE
jgi:epoxyqueuosine reductase